MQHVTNHEVTLEVEGGAWKRVLTVETDLELDESAEGFDGEALNKLIAEMEAFMRAGGYQSARVKRGRADA